MNEAQQAQLPAEPGAAAPKSRRRLARADFLRDIVLVLAWLVLLALFSFLSPYFFTVQNFKNIGLAISIIGIASIGATVVMVSGGIDLTVGSVIGLSVITIGAMLTLGLGVAPAMLATLLVALFVGLVNGFLIVKGRINPLIATLGMMSVIRGFAYVYSGGISHAIVSKEYGVLGRGNLGGVPFPILAMLLLFVIMWAIMKYTDLGHYVYSIGDNAHACRLAGVDVSKWRYVVYLIGAGFAALAGMFLASLMQASLPQAGNTYELSIIAAVILGGTSLSGGIGNVFGTLLGVLIMGTLDNGFTLLNVPAFYQMIAKGAVLILAVFIDQVRTGGYE